MVWNDAAIAQALLEGLILAMAILNGVKPLVIKRLYHTIAAILILICFEKYQRYWIDRALLRNGLIVKFTFVCIPHS